MLIQTADGPRYFVSRSRLRETLALSDVQYAAAVELLEAGGFVRRHRRNRSPAHGFVLPEGWSSEHRLHLRRIARNLLADQGIRTEDPSLSPGSSAGKTSDGVLQSCTQRRVVDPVHVPHRGLQVGVTKDSAYLSDRNVRAVR